MCIRAPRPLIRLESASFSFGSLTRVVRSFVLEKDAPKRTLISRIVTELPRIKKWQSDRGRENEKEKEREKGRFHIVTVPENQCTEVEKEKPPGNFSAITLRVL